MMLKVATEKRRKEVLAQMRQTNTKTEKIVEISLVEDGGKKNKRSTVVPKVSLKPKKAEEEEEEESSKNHQEEEQQLLKTLTIKSFLHQKYPPERVTKRDPQLNWGEKWNHPTAVTTLLERMHQRWSRPPPITIAWPRRRRRSEKEE